MVRWAIVVVAFVALLAVSRPFAAWWCDDVGNLAFARGDTGAAELWLARGLRLEPGWHVLLEDHGRSILERNPAQALVEFTAAQCGAPCLAERGDAEAKLGKPRLAVDDYLEARAVGRVASAAESLATAGRFDGAIALEAALAARLGTGMLTQADLASAYFTIGNFDVRAAHGGRAARRRAYERDAIRSYQRASQLAPFNEGYLLSLGFAQAQWGDRGLARAAFQRVLELHPHESDAERGLAQLGVPLDSR